MHIILNINLKELRKVCYAAGLTKTTQFVINLKCQPLVTEMLHSPQVVVCVLVRSTSTDKRN
jgi:hypothetical protein